MQKELHPYLNNNDDDKWTAANMSSFTEKKKRIFYNIKENKLLVSSLSFKYFPNNLNWKLFVVSVQVVVYALDIEQEMSALHWLTCGGDF